VAPSVPSRSGARGLGLLGDDAVKKKLAAQYVFLVLMLGGCGTPNSVKQTNFLNGEAARWIVETSPDPAIDRAATTIAAGSDQIARKLGDPEERPVYTPEVHEKTVDQAKDDIDQQEAVKKGITGWIEKAVGTVADIIYPGLGGILMGAFFWLRKNAQYDKLKKGTDVIVRAVEKVPGAKDAVSALATKVGAGSLVDAVVKSVAK